MVYTIYMRRPYGYRKSKSGKLRGGAIDKRCTLTFQPPPRLIGNGRQKVAVAVAHSAGKQSQEHHWRS